jgi:hypothetical protein
VRKPRQERPSKRPPRKPREGEGGFGGGGVGTIRERAVAVLLRVAEGASDRSAMARVAAAKALLEAEPKPVQVPGWVPTATDSEPEPASPEDDPSWT